MSRYSPDNPEPLISEEDIAYFVKVCRGNMDKLHSCLLTTRRVRMRLLDRGIIAHCPTCGVLYSVNSDPTCIACQRREGSQR